MKTPGWPEGDLPPGTRVGEYVIREAVGRGAAQAAYLADSDDGRKLVLKMSLFPECRKGSRHWEMHARFMRQVTQFSQLDGAVAVAHMDGHGMFRYASDRYAYLAQEWVPGGLNILDWSREEPHPLKALVAGWILLATACAKMTGRGICHRDLKPENILVRPDGVPKIVDFNSSKSVGAQTLTARGPGSWPGTPLYYSPEVCRAFHMDYTGVYRMSFAELATADLHALGVIFYQVLTGVYPFDKLASEEELFEQIACQVPDPPTWLNQEVPAGLGKVTMKLLRKDPEKRYQFGDEVVAELLALLDTDEDWMRPFQTPGKEPRRAPSRSPSPPMVTDGSAAFDSRPSASAVAAPKALVLLPRPEPEPRPSLLRRARRPAVALIVALGLGCLAVGLHLAGPLIEKGTAVVSKKMTAVVAAAFTACAHLTGKVITGEREWLEECPAESRKAVHEFGIDPAGGFGYVLPGPHVIIQPWNRGLEVQDGPAVVGASLNGTRDKGYEADLYGTIKTGTDGAIIHFDKMKLFQDGDTRETGPSGPERAICAIGYAPGFPDPGGMPKAEIGVPRDFKPHPGFLLVTSERVQILFAH